MAIVICQHGPHWFRMQFSRQPIFYRCPVCQKPDLAQRTGGGKFDQLPHTTDPILDLRGARQVPLVSR